MAYQVLARKWRPQDFSSVVGQESIVTALGNALAENRISQAYLFSGIRGIGKTSVARIFAKALNCIHGPTSKPCNECEPCREITQGNDLDVLEIDAATYSKVEQVRELTESLRYGPARDRYKVVILDEVHRLSRQAFDALLKIIEEPPSHLVFVFATTEIEAVPATILSRCQEFNFRRVPLAAMTEHLSHLAREESITASPAALAAIARAGEGSVRDAVALLDQLATFGSGTISDDATAKLIGGIGAAHLQHLLEAILAGDAVAVANLIDESLALGFDPRRTFGDFLAYCRDGLHLALDSNLAVEMPSEAAESLREIAGRAGYENLLRLINHLLASETGIRRSEVGGLALEIALLRAAELPKLVRVEELLGRLPESDPLEVATPPPPAHRRQPIPTGTAASPDPQQPPAVGNTVSTDPHEATEPPVPKEATSRDSPVGRFLQQVSLHRQALSAHLSAAIKLEFSQGELCIHHASDDAWLPKKLARRENREALTRAAEVVWGQGTTWRLLPVKIDQAEQRTAALPARDPQDSAEKHPGESPDELPDDPAIQTVLDIFGGRIEGVDRSRATEDEQERQEDEPL